MNTARREAVAANSAILAGFDAPVKGEVFKAAMSRVATRIINYGDSLFAAPTRYKNWHCTVRVTFIGTGAFCKHERLWYGVQAHINLPALKDERVLSRQEANRWLGYLVHECFHVVFTSREEWDKYVGTHSAFRRHLLNAVEDARIERDGIACGVALGYTKVGSLLLEHLLADGGADVDPNQPGQLPWVFALGLRPFAVPGFDRLLRKLHPAVRAILLWARGQMKVDVPQATALTLDKGTVQAAALADQIADKLKALYGDPNVPPPPGEGEGEGNQPDEGDGEEGKGKGKGKGNDESDEGDESDGEGEGADGEGDESEDGEGEGEGEGADGEDESGDEGEGEGEDGDGEDDGAGDGPASDEESDGKKRGKGGDISQRPTGEKAVDLDALGSNEITEVEPTIRCDRDFDKQVVAEVIDPMQEVDVDGEYPDESKRALARRHAESMMRSVKNLAGARTALRRLLQRTDSHGDVRGLRGGRLVPTVVHRAMLGDDSIFSRRWEQEGVDVAVSVVIDTSGSMSGNAIRAAATTGLIIAEQLSMTPGCRVEVIGFTSDVGSYAHIDHDVVRQLRSGGTQVAFRGACGARVFKRFGEPIAKMRGRWNSMLYASGGTPDIAALHGVAQRLAVQPAGRKIVFFICDGEGSPQPTFREAVSKLSTKYGLLVIGLGIGCMPEFAQRFQFGAVVNDVNHLAKDALDLIARAVEKAGAV